MKNNLAEQFGFRSLLKFSLPTIIMMVFMSLYTMVDGIFVSRLIGTDALSAVNLVFPMLSVIIAIGVMLATGGSAVVAIQMGEGNSRAARENFSLIVLTGLGMGVVFNLSVFVFLEPLLHFLGADGPVLDLCREYASVLVWFTIPAILQMLFQTFFVTAGRPAIGLTVTALGGLMNIVFDYLFIAVFQWGVAGAAAATGIGMCMPAVFGLLWFALSRKGTLYFVRPVWRGRVLLHTLVNGSSEMVTNLSTAVITYLFNIIMMSLLGADGVAAITIVLYAEYLLVAIYLGYSTGIAPILSYNFGEENYTQLKQLFKISITFITVCSAVTFAGALWFAPAVVGIFAVPGSPVYGLAVHGFYLYALSYLFKGTNIFASSLFTALSDGKTSAILSFLRSLVFIVAGIALLPLALGLNGVWLAVPFAEVLSVALSFYCFRRLACKRWDDGIRRAASLPPKRQPCQ